MPTSPPTRIPLVQGAYTAQSFIASAQRALNLYNERNPQGEDSPGTIYNTPGLTRLGIPPQVDPVRCLYRGTNGEGFAAIGDGIYYVHTDWTFTPLGTTASLPTPIKMQDNGIDILIVDGTSSGWTVNLATHTFAAVSDPNFYGSNYVEALDTYLILDKPDDTIFYSTDSNAITFDPLFFAAKTGYPDNISAIAVRDRLIWLVGNQATAELWSDVGAADFPFQRLDGPFIEHGSEAKYSLAKQGSSIFWLSQNQSGVSIVVQGKSLAAERISTHAMETVINSYPVRSDAIGFCYEQLGHEFYWLKFPSANGGLGADWVYDISTKLWHERGWLNSTSCEIEGHRARAAALMYGIVVVGDRENGQLYMLDPNNSTDAGNFIERRRGWPHMMANGSRASYPSFVADMQPAVDGIVSPAPVLPPVLAPVVTFPMTITVIDTTFTAPDDTLLQDYFNPWGLTDTGSQYTQIDDTIDGEIEDNVLTGSGTGTMSYLASGAPTSPDYIAQFQAIPANYTDPAGAGKYVWLLARSNIATTEGYRAVIVSDGSTYQAALEVAGGGATTTVEAGLIASGYFQVYLSLQGTAIDMAVQRSIDSFWLNSDATWTLAFAKAISLTDATWTAKGNIIIGGAW